MVCNDYFVKPIRHHILHQWLLGCQLAVIVVGSRFSAEILVQLMRRKPFSLSDTYPCAEVAHPFVTSPRSIVYRSQQRGHWACYNPWAGNVSFVRLRNRVSFYSTSTWIQHNRILQRSFAANGHLLEISFHYSYLSGEMWFKKH